MADARKRAEEALAGVERERLVSHIREAAKFATRADRMVFLHDYEAKALVAVIDALRALLAEPARETENDVDRLHSIIEIEREGQRSMARALAEINRLSRLDVAINLAQPAPACGSVSTVRSDDPPAKPLPTCAACGSNFITPAPAADAVVEAAERELCAIDALLDRRDALDGLPSRYDKILLALRVAERCDPKGEVAGALRALDARRRG